MKQEQYSDRHLTLSDRDTNIQLLNYRAVDTRLAVTYLAADHQCHFADTKITLLRYRCVNYLLKWLHTK